MAPSGLAEAMVQIDALVDRLDGMKAMGWRPLPTAPDESPAHSARLLGEQFREAGRLGLGPKVAGFRERLAQAESGAAALQEALGHSDRVASEAAWKTVRAQCAACHREFRDGR